MKRIDLTINNTSPVDLTCELFNAMNSFTTVQNLVYPVPNFSYKPQGAMLDTLALPTGAGFFANGDAVSISATGYAGGFMQITSARYPYHSLIRSLLSRNIKIESIKLQGNAPLIQLNINHFIRKMDGQTDVLEVIDTVRFITPNQVQTNIIQIDQPYLVTPFTGFSFIMKPGNIAISIDFEYQQ